MSDVGRAAMARVLLLNDEATTMEFVVQVLQSVFGKTYDEALKLVLEVHHHGSAECGVYPLDEASDVVARVTALADRSGYPLRCIVKPAP